MEYRGVFANTMLGRARPFFVALALLASAPALANSPWVVEAESPQAKVAFTRNFIDIDSPGGITLWWHAPITGPAIIRFAARPVANGGPNDTLSDLNAFWMASEVDGSSPLGLRSGRFEAYDTLRTYYVGIGGNRNTTTRMRRYVGEPGNRPLLPQHDRADAAALLMPGGWTTITLTAQGQQIGVARDGTPIFTMTDPAPYTRGWFGFRTTASHWQLCCLRIIPLPKGTP